MNQLNDLHVYSLLNIDSFENYTVLEADSHDY